MERAELITPQLLEAWPLPAPDHRGDKHARGTVHVIGGATSTPGAVLLAGVSALRAGAGRLQITTVETTAVTLAVQVPEAMVVGRPADESGSLLDADPDSADAVVLGPGVLGGGVQKLVASVVSGSPGALVLDALALVDLEPQELAERTVLTPNLGELEALAGRSGDVLDLARDVSERFGAAVCTQGWVTAPGGGCWRNEVGSVGLGTSGSGDVLAGIVGGLLARGAAADQAAVWGAYVHAAAGDLLAARRTPLGYLARELSEVVPEVMSGVHAGMDVRSSGARTR